MKLIRFSILLISIINLSACDFLETKEKTYFKCAYVATHLGQDLASAEITKGMEAYFKENNSINSSLDALRLSEEVQNDLGLYALNSMGKFKKLIDVYNSSSCQSLHSQGKVSPDMY